MKVSISSGLAALALALTFGAGSQAEELVMVEQQGCAYCDMWDHEISAIYPKTAEGAFAPLRRVQLRDLRASDTAGLDLTRPVSFTPTFLLVENEAELARIEGYPGQDFFWGLLEMMLTAHTDFVEPGS